MSFIDVIKERAKKDVKTIVLPEATDARVIEAASQIVAEGIAKIVLIGKEDEIKSKFSQFDLSGIRFVDPENNPKKEEYIQKLVQLRQRKGMTRIDAESLLTEDRLYLGVMMVKTGDADGMVAGAVSATANVLRPSLQILKTAANTKLISSFFIMSVPNCEYGEKGTFIFADAGLNQNPDSEELASIAYSASKSCIQLLEVEPIVAMLSHSTMGSAKHADVDKVTKAVFIAQERYPDLKCDGEFQLDAAIVPEIGQQKAPGNDIAGHANVLVFPDLDAGNIGYKLVQRLANADAYGPISQGIAKPVNDLSRGCSVDDIVGVVAITAVQSQGME